MVTNKSFKPSHLDKVIKGLPSHERLSLSDELSQQNHVWREVLTEDENWMIVEYSRLAYSVINAYLRESSPNQHSLFLQNKYITRGYINQDINLLDQALSKTPKPLLRKLYRYYRNPEPIPVAEYIRKTFRPGKVFTEKGFMSTSCDPEYVMAHIQSHSPDSQYFVIEVITDKGVPLHDNTHYPITIQSLELECLIPRGNSFSVTQVKEDQSFQFHSHRDDLYQYYMNTSSHSPDVSNSWAAAGRLMVLPLVQMVDTTLSV